MEAKDTVMNKDQLEEVVYLDVLCEPDSKELGEPELRAWKYRAIANRQAEISFKAGYKQRQMEEHHLVQEGRREVIEFINKNGGLNGLPDSWWQFKLKEWGI